jgi:hypothetical protein
VHALPERLTGQQTPGDIRYPEDLNGQAFPLSTNTAFETVFFSSAVAVEQGKTVTSVDFAVRPRPWEGRIHSVETYSYVGNTPVRPAYLSPGARPLLVAAGAELVPLAARGNLSASVVGGAALNIRPYTQSYVIIDFDPQTLLIPSDTPRHIVFSANGDLHVLPSAFYHAQRQPPAITNVTAGVDGGVRVVAVTGINLGPDTRVLFDGIQGQFRDFDSGQGRLTVVPPPAAPGHRAVVTALNPDGQSSLFVQSETPASYTYPENGGTPAVLITAGANMWPGMESMIQVNGLNTNFAQGLTTLGFGSTDIAVRSIYVVSPTQLWANVVVAPTAQPGLANLAILSGLQQVQQSQALQVQAAPARAFWLSADVLNPVTSRSSLVAGQPATVTLGAAPGPVNTANTMVVIGDARVPAASVNGNQVTFVVPPGTPNGPVPIRLETGADRSQPIVVEIDAAPPRVVTASATTVRLGELLALIVADLGNGAESHVGVTIGGKHARVIQVVENGSRHTVLVQVPDDCPVGEGIPATVSVDGRTSDAIKLTINR